MAVLPHQNPVEPDTSELKDPIHHPHKQEHPGPDDREWEQPGGDEDEAADG